MKEENISIARTKKCVKIKDLLKGKNMDLLKGKNMELLKEENNSIARIK